MITNHLRKSFISLSVGICALSLVCLSLSSMGFAQSKKGSQGSSSEEAKSNSVPAIKVGTASISKSEFQNRVQRRVQRRKMRQKMMQQKSKGKKGKAPKMPEIDEDRIREQVKEQTIKQLVLEHHAKKSDVEVSKKEVNNEWQKMVDRFGSEEKLTKRLEKSGKNKSDLMKDLKSYLKIKKFVEQNTSESEVTDQDVRDFYEKNKKRMGNKSFEKMKERIRQMLEQRKLREARSGLVEDLRKDTDIDVNL